MIALHSMQSIQQIGKGMLAAGVIHLTPLYRKDLSLIDLRSMQRMNYA